MLHSLFIKIEVELLSQALVLLMYLNADHAYFCLGAIIEATIVEDELHVLHELLNALVLLFFQLTLDS